MELEDSKSNAVQQQEAETTPKEANSGMLRTRTYDLMMSYDKFHAVPRFWLVGYSEDGMPLSEAQVREDICHEHYNETVTLEPFPSRSSSLPVVSIHPCKHGSVMHKLSHIVAGEGQTFNVEHYMVLFLKFISSVVITIEYDYTMSAGGM